MKQLTELKSVDWIKDVPAQSLQEVIERLDKAYQSFFRGAGFPKWAKKFKYNSITFKSVSIKDWKIILPKIGALKYFCSQEVKGELRRATIIKKHDVYYISILTKQESETIHRSHDSQVGIDMGVAFFSSLSSGQQIDNPRFTKQYERELRIEQRSLSRKVKGSNNRAKQRNRVARVHAKIANSRKDFLHKISTALVLSHSLIAREDLKVSNMVRFGNLSKHIADVSWAEFFTQLEYKAIWYGSEIVKVDPKYTSQTCNNCGSVDKKSRVSQSKYVCTSCGTESNADLNAAKNILGRAMSNFTKRKALT